jgi:hypothetical protein
LDRLEQLVTMIAKVIAWDQLHSGGYRGAASAIDLMDFAHSRRWRDALLSYHSRMLPGWTKTIRHSVQLLIAVPLTLYRYAGLLSRNSPAIYGSGGLR